MFDTLRLRLAALAAAGGLATAAHAQPPVPDAGVPTPPAPQTQPLAPAPVEPGADKPVPPPGGPAACEPKVIRWAGGSVTVNGPEVVVRTAGRGGSTNVISGSGNGRGNTVVVDGGRGGLTVVQNARNGVGNRLIVNDDDTLVDLDDDLADLPGWVRRAAGVPPVVTGKPAPQVQPVPNPPVPAPQVQPVPPAYRGKTNPFWSRKAWSEAHDCNLYWGPADKLWFRYGSDDDTYRPVAGGPEPPAP